jgi:hypothetical protein
LGVREPTEKTSFNLPHSVMERLRARAYEQRMTQTDLVVQALDLLFSADADVVTEAPQTPERGAKSRTEREFLVAVEGLSSRDIQVLIAFARMLRSPAAGEDPDFAVVFLEAFRDAMRRVLPPTPSKAELERIRGDKQKGKKGA